MEDAEFLKTILLSTQNYIYWLIGLFCAFTLLAKVSACNPNQPIWRDDASTDFIYGLILPFFTRLINIIFVTLGLSLIFWGTPTKDLLGYFTYGHGPLSELPIWLQAAIVFIVSDIMLYWTHRWFHTGKMWPFHAIHHSSEKLDWLSTYRFHPVNTWLSFTMVDSLMLIVGFSPAATAAMGTFNLIYSAMVHANLNWTFGPFKYVFASPVFHRWHHTSQEEGMNKNFAPTFPLLDIMFGTFYMPDNKLPEKYGVPGSDIPKSFAGQLLWPFKQR